MKTDSLSISYRGETLNLDYFVRPAFGNCKATLVYFHGLGAPKEYFEGALERPDFKDYTIIGFDFPGLGKSTYPQNAMLGIDDLVAIARAFLVKLKIEKYFIIGHSMGALVGLLFAEKFPDQVLGFVNVDGTLSPAHSFVSRKVSGMTFDDFKNNFLGKFIDECAQSPKKGVRAYAKSVAASDPKAFYYYCPSLKGYAETGHLLDRFQKLKCPKIFIYGSENRDVSYIPLIKEKICPIFEIPSSTHFMMYDNPEAYYKVIANFLLETCE